MVVTFNEKLNTGNKKSDDFEFNGTFTTDGCDIKDMKVVFNPSKRTLNFKGSVSLDGKDYKDIDLYSVIDGCTINFKNPGISLHGFEVTRNISFSATGGIEVFKKRFFIDTVIDHERFIISDQDSGNTFCNFIKRFI